MTKHICCFWVGVFFNMDALKNHLKIKITGSEKAQMSEEQNT